MVQPIWITNSDKTVDYGASLLRQTETDAITSGQLTMTGSAVRPSATSKVYKKLILFPKSSNGDIIFLGNSGVTISNGLELSELVPVVLYNVDVSTIYAIGTASDILTWAGTE